MFASFHSTGTTPCFNDKLNTLASGILILILILLFPLVVLEVSHSLQVIYYTLEKAYFVVKLLSILSWRPGDQAPY